MAVAILGPVFASARVAARQSTLLSNLKHLSNAWLEYASDYDDRSCPVAGWNELLLYHKQSGLREEHLIDVSIECRADADCMDNRALGLNAQLDGVEQTRLSVDETPSFAQTRLRNGEDALATRDSLPEDRVFLALAGGSVRVMSSEKAKALRWDVPAKEIASKGASR